MSIPFQELLEFDVATLSGKLRARDISPVELTEAYLGRIEQTDGSLRAYITVTDTLARKAAKKAEVEIARKVARTISRRSDRAQGSGVHQGNSHHGWFENPRRLQTRSRRDRVDAPQARRRRAARQAQPARV